MTSLLFRLGRLYDCWWFWGVLGWVLVLLNYPMESVLPVYAE